MYCLINFLIFYYRIIFSESKILLFSDVKFIEILIKVIDLCNDKYFLLNCFQLFKFKIANLEYQKSIIEIIFDISIQLFLNNENSAKCYNILMEKYNQIFYDRKFDDYERKSIFYVNDCLKFFIEKNTAKSNDNDLKFKLKCLKKYNEEFFVKENIFNGNMTTYFLCLICENQKKINT